MSREPAVIRMWQRLGETCATCQHFAVPRPDAGACRVPPNNGVLFRAVPPDGSGYCWQWEKKR